jgi:hypothetical protein
MPSGRHPGVRAVPATGPPFTAAVFACHHPLMLIDVRG